MTALTALSNGFTINLPASSELPPPPRQVEPSEEDWEVFLSDDDLEPLPEWGDLWLEPAEVPD